MRAETKNKASSAEKHIRPCVSVEQPGVRLTSEHSLSTQCARQRRRHSASKLGAAINRPCKSAGWNLHLLVLVQCATPQQDANRSRHCCHPQGEGLTQAVPAQTQNPQPHMPLPQDSCLAGYGTQCRACKPTSRDHTALTGKKPRRYSSSSVETQATCGHCMLAARKSARLRNQSGQQTPQGESVDLGMYPACCCVTSCWVCPRQHQSAQFGAGSRHTTASQSGLC